MSKVLKLPEKFQNVDQTKSTKIKLQKTRTHRQALVWIQNSKSFQIKNIWTKDLDNSWMNHSSF